MTWHRAVGAWLDWLRAGAARAATVELRAAQIRRLAADLGGSPWDVTVDVLAAWLGGHRWSVETIRSHRAALRSFYGWAHAAGHCGTDPSRLLRRVAAAPPRPRPASDAVIAAAILAADDRVRLMIELGARHGLRRGEIAGIHSRDVVDDLVGWSLVVHGKGGKDRTVPLQDSTAARLRSRPAGWIFPNGLGGPLTAAHTGRLISRVLGPGVTPHQLRHRFATTTYRATRDIESVRLLLGHSSVATTQRYVAVEADSLRAAVNAA